MEPTTTDPIELEDEANKRLAEQLQLLLTERQVPCVLHWDRSPWGVRVWLTPHDGQEYATPSFYALVENGEWSFVLGGFSEEHDDVFNAFTIGWHSWGRNIHAMADDLLPLLKILRRGVTDLVWDGHETDWRWDG